jgi:hypothetical protein
MQNRITYTAGLLVVLACAPAAQGDANTTLADTAGTASAQAGDTSLVQQSDSGVSLTLDKTEYAPGAAAVMTLSSQRSDTLGYNPCSSRSVERDMGGNWVVHAEPNRMCTMELRMLNPGQSQSVPATLPGDLTAGTYRIVMQFQPQSAGGQAAGSVRAVSPSFTVAMGR